MDRAHDELEHGHGHGERARKFTNGQTARPSTLRRVLPRTGVCVCGVGVCVCCVAVAAVRVGGDVCIVHFAATTNTREYRKNAGAEQTLLKHMLIFPPHGAKPCPGRPQLF